MRVMYQPASVVTHLDGSSYGTDQRDVQSLRNHASFCRKWARSLNVQPAANSPLFVNRQRPATAGTILVMEDRIPEPDRNAGAAATAQYVTLLVSLGLQVIYYPHDGRAPAGYTAVLQQQGVEVLHRPVVIQDWLRENGRHLGLCLVHAPLRIRPPDRPAAPRYGALIIYLTHDLHYLREMRRYAVDRDPMALGEAARVREIELSTFSKVDCVLSFSEDEARFIREAVPTAQVRVTPLFFYDGSVSVDEASGFTARRKLLFVGGFNHLPNVDAAVWLVREIMPWFGEAIQMPRSPSSARTRRTRSPCWQVHR